tara:strand:- start:45 stop:293 length:249 start_codon:yes stop_codon:yes gene_type:complete
MRYFKIEFFKDKGLFYYCKGIEELISIYDDIDSKTHISSWTVKEYSDSDYTEVISECGSDHYINAGAIFYSIFEGEGELETI